MKQKDIMLIVVVIVVSAVMSVVLSNVLITAPKHRQEQVEVVDPITADFPQLDKKYFNDKSIDPTQLIKIGDNSNKQPFNSNSQ